MGKEASPRASTCTGCLQGPLGPHFQYCLREIPSDNMFPSLQSLPHTWLMPLTINYKKSFCFFHFIALI